MTRKSCFYSLFLVHCFFLGGDAYLAAKKHTSIPSENPPQFTSAGHVLAFQPLSVAVAGLSQLLRFDFVGADEIRPETRQAADSAKYSPSGDALYRNLGNGISSRYETKSGSVLKNTYEIVSGGEPSLIRLRHNVPAQISKDGSLLLAFAEKEMRESAPVAWQEIEDRRRHAPAYFRALPNGEIGFTVGDYDYGISGVADQNSNTSTLLFGGICSYLQEDFSGTPNQLWGGDDQGTWTWTNGQLDVGDINAAPSDFSWYGGPFSPPADLFTLDMDVQVLANTRNFGFETAASSGDYPFSINGQNTYEIAVFIFPGNIARIQGWDPDGNAILSSTYSVAGDLRSIGVQYTASAVILRVNKSNTPVQLSGLFNASLIHKMDVIYFTGQGQGTHVRFDNLCMGPTGAYTGAPTSSAPTSSTTTTTFTRPSTTTTTSTVFTPTTTTTFTRPSTTTTTSTVFTPTTTTLPPPGESCSYFSEDFSGASGAQWNFYDTNARWTWDRGRLHVDQVQSGTLGWYEYYPLSIGGYFTIDMDIDVASMSDSPDSFITLLPFSYQEAAFPISFTSGDAMLYGVGVLVDAQKTVSFVGLGEEQPYYSAIFYQSEDPITSIGILYDSAGFTIRVNKKNTSVIWFSDYTPEACQKIDALSLAVMGTVTEAYFDNICISPLQLCETHPADLNGDYFIDISEVNLYFTAWIRQSPSNLVSDAYVANAVWLWENGESYACDPSDDPPWIPGAISALRSEKTRNSMRSPGGKAIPAYKFDIPNFGAGVRSRLKGNFSRGPQRY